MWSSNRSGRRSDRARGRAADAVGGYDDDHAVLDDDLVDDHAVLDNDHIDDDALLDDHNHTLLDDDDHPLLNDDHIDDDAVLDDDHVDDPAPHDDHHHDERSGPEGADLPQGQIDHGRRERRRHPPEPRGYVGPVPVAGSREALAIRDQDVALLAETRCRG